MLFFQGLEGIWGPERCFGLDGVFIDGLCLCKLVFMDVCRGVGGFGCRCVGACVFVWVGVCVCVRVCVCVCVCGWVGGWAGVCVGVGVWVRVSGWGWVWEVSMT